MLFPNDAVVMILARIIGMFGSIDMEMLVKGQETHKYFTKEYDIYYINEVCFPNFFPLHSYSFFYHICRLGEILGEKTFYSGCRLQLTFTHLLGRGK